MVNSYINNYIFTLHVPVYLYLAILNNLQSIIAAKKVSQNDYMTILTSKYKKDDPLL